jgi:hypothetical protein
MDRLVGARILLAEAAALGVTIDDLIAESSSGALGTPGTGPDCRRGSPAQNLYRMAYEQPRLNGLGARAEIGPTTEDAHAVAIQTVRKHHPDFTRVWDIRIDLDRGLQPERFCR